MPGLGRLGKHGNHLFSRETVATGSEYSSLVLVMFLLLQALECSLRALAQCGPPESLDKEVILHIFETYKE